MPRTKMTFEKLEREYALLWKDVVIRDRWQSRLDRRATKILGNKHRYLIIQQRTGVPWYVVGVIHSMEAGLRFNKHLHNGDSLKKRTYRVPAGRPVSGNPPFSWEESAGDALLMKRLDRVKEWSPERCCFELERYNGFGYRWYHSNTLSPYLWSGTTHYRRGKYVADGKWSNRAVSQQTGAMALLKVLSQMDKSVTFNKKPVKTPPDIPVASPLPEQELIDKSKKLTVIGHCKQFAAFTVTSVGGLFTVDNMGVAKDWITDVKEIAFSNAIWVVVAMAVGAWLVSSYLQKRAIKDNAEGRYVPSGAVKV